MSQPPREPRRQLLRTAVLVALAVELAVRLIRLDEDHPAILVASSWVTAGLCWLSAWHLLGLRAAAVLLALGGGIGLAAEELGVRTGIVFGDYHYTELLGPKLGVTPIVIPFTWFALAYLAYVLTNLIAIHAPLDAEPGLAPIALRSLLSAFIVAAYDLALDPYMVVYKKGWVFTEHGPYFTEPFHGLYGWVAVMFLISFLFRFWLGRLSGSGPRPPRPPTALDALVPIAAWAYFGLFFVLVGQPEATRAIACFATGIPVLAALMGWMRWRQTQG